MLNAAAFPPLPSRPPVPRARAWDGLGGRDRRPQPVRVPGRQRISQPLARGGPGLLGGGWATSEVCLRGIALA
eukprot:12729625-Alexandrium_andersonii.AAC.1